MLSLCGVLARQLSSLAWESGFGISGLAGLYGAKVLEMYQILAEMLTRRLSTT
jgi:hypothetical protein